MTSYGTQSHYSDQRFAAADGNVGDFPPLYSDLPFSRRRKYGQSRDKDAIKWAMRCVLASPVIVLCLWTVGAFVFANKHVGSNTSTQLKQRQAQMAPQSPQLLMMPQQQLMQAQPFMMATQQGGQPLQLQQEQPQMQQPVMMMSQEQAQPMQQTMEEQPAMQQATEQAPVMQQTMQEQPMMQRAKKSKNKKSHFRNPSQPQQQQPGAINLVPRDQPMAIQPPPQQPRQQILYYEPSHAMANGKLEAPMVVYDLNGNPIPLQSLKGAQIYMEPPLKQQVQAPLKGISTSDIKDWGQSPAQDQSIIVATVAVMALLVGAISARRMRSRNILSSCIENEALEDDVAYDTAYTTTQKDNSYYNTFASGGWKGDLEKFDV